MRYCFEMDNLIFKKLIEKMYQKSGKISQVSHNCSGYLSMANAKTGTVLIQHFSELFKDKSCHFVVMFN